MERNDALILKITEGFFENAKENNLVIKFQENLKFFTWTLEKHLDYFEMLTSPFTDEKDKHSSLDKNYKDVLIPEVLYFIKKLVSLDQIKYIQAIKDIFDDLAYKHNNVLEGIIYTPFEISDEMQNKITKAFEKKLKSECTFKVSIDQSLIAGIRVLINGTIYEYSISSSLNDIKDNLSNSLAENK